MAKHWFITYTCENKSNWTSSVEHGNVVIDKPPMEWLAEMYREQLTEQYKITFFCPIPEDQFNIIKPHIPFNVIK